MGTSAHDSGLLLETITRAQKAYQVGESTRALFNEMLSDLLELTSSEYGFIGEVLEGSEGEPYLKTHAITNIAWSDDTRKFYAENAPTGMEFRNLKSLFGEVLSTGEAVVANSPSTDPRRCGIPEGHPSLDAFLGAPFSHGGHFVGMVGLANRPGGYDEELLNWLQPLLTTCAGIIAVNRAWAQQERVERTLRTAKNEAEEASATKSRFLANMSHELRTPLNAIVGFTQVLLKKDKEPSAVKLLERVRVNGLTLMTLVDDILDVARIEEGAIEIHEEDFDLGELVQNLVDDLQIRVGEKTTLKTELPDTSLVLHTDKNRMRQVITNLTVNALKFTMEGTVIVRVRVTKDASVAVIEVDDTGIGIAPDALERIFDAFQQADNTHARAHDGAGLGLALSRTLAQLLGFDLTVESTLGIGSIFRLIPKGLATS